MVTRHHRYAKGRGSKASDLRSALPSASGCVYPLRCVGATRSPGLAHPRSGAPPYTAGRLAEKAAQEGRGARINAKLKVQHLATDVRHSKVGQPPNNASGITNSIPRQFGSPRISNKPSILELRTRSTITPDRLAMPVAFFMLSIVNSVVANRGGVGIRVLTFRVWLRIIPMRGGTGKEVFQPRPSIFCLSSRGKGFLLLKATVRVILLKRF
jgi:hypothetical protein